jgi:hypothetical protein
MADKKPAAKKSAPAKKAAPAKKTAAKKAPAKKAAAPKKIAEKKTEEVAPLLGTIMPKATTSTNAAGHTHVTFTVPESVDKIVDDLAPVFEAAKKTNFFKRLFKKRA